MADHDIEGQMQVILHLLLSREWRAVWTELAMSVESFASLGLSPSISDAELWQFCQTQQIMLLTGNRNHEGPESLEAIIRTAGRWRAVRGENEAARSATASADCSGA